MKTALINTMRLAAAASMIVGAGVWANPALAQKFDANGIGRTELVRHDLDAGHETSQVRVDFAPGALAPAHSHPGVEIAHVLAGTIEYTVDGKPVTLQTGDSLFLPPGAIHSAKNIGTGNASELATYILEKGKPVVIPAR